MSFKKKLYNDDSIDTEDAILKCKRNTGLIFDTTINNYTNITFPMAGNVFIIANSLTP